MLTNMLARKFSNAIKTFKNYIRLQVALRQECSYQSSGILFRQIINCKAFLEKKVSDFSLITRIILVSFFI